MASFFGAFQHFFLALHHCTYGTR